MHTKNEIVTKCYVHTTNEIVTKCNGGLILDSVLFLVVFYRLEGEDRAKAGRERKGKGNHLDCCLVGRDYAIASVLHNS